MDSWNELKEAAIRCAGYQSQYGVLAKWSVDEHFLTLIMSDGHDRVERTINHTAFEQSVGKSLLRLENSALAGLSD